MGEGRQMFKQGVKVDFFFLFLYIHMVSLGL